MEVEKTTFGFKITRVIECDTHDEETRKKTRKGKFKLEDSKPKDERRKRRKRRRRKRRKRKREEEEEGNKQNDTMKKRRKIDLDGLNDDERELYLKLENKGSGFRHKRNIDEQKKYRKLCMKLNLMRHREKKKKLQESKDEELRRKDEIIEMKNKEILELKKKTGYQ